MIKTDKLGEVQTKIIDEVKKTDELKVLLRYGWGAEEITGKLVFNPSEDLKAGDEVKVIIERVYEEPEPEEEKEKVAGQAAETPEAEGGEEANVTTEESEPLKVDEEKEATTEESEPPKAEGGGEGTVEKI
jgi:hypothetical protein